MDPSAIPAMTYEAQGWNPFPDAGPTRFDAPRVQAPGQPFWDIWNLFRQTMIWRHNIDVARWMTTSADPETGLSVPADRWFSDQIPADYLFGSTPATPNLRLETSASPWWTADVSPYGSLGLTSFNIVRGTNIYPTLRNVAPVVAARNVRWGLLEYHASLPVTDRLDVYLQDMAVIEQYRPALIVPVYWGDPYSQIQNTGFEVALRELVNRIKDGPAAASAPIWPSAPQKSPAPASTPPPAPLDLRRQLERLRGRY